MKISPFAIEKTAPFITADNTGRQLISLFAPYGIRDVYDEKGLPDIGKKNGQRPSRTEYVKNRIAILSENDSLRAFISTFVNSNPDTIAAFSEILGPEGFQITELNGQYHIQGGVINNAEQILNEAHFQDIQNRILQALDQAQVSIRVVMAWFTNETLFNKLLEKHNEGIDVKIAIFDDGINKKHGVDVTQLSHTMIKRGQRGGLMHNKYCVIDNQIVITGSYNWSDNAEFKNDENITIEYDPKQGTLYSVEFRRLTS